MKYPVISGRKEIIQLPSKIIGLYVRKMTQLDFTWERREELIRTEERAEGQAKGQMCKLISLVVKKMKKNYPVEQIANELEEEEAVIRKICKVAEQFAPEYDVEQIYKALTAELE